jgi:hypothetical protein
MTTTMTMSFKAMVQLTPELKNFIETFNLIQLDDTAEWLAITDDGQTFLVADVQELPGVTDPLTQKSQIMMYNTIEDFTIEFPA